MDSKKNDKTKKESEWNATEYKIFVFCVYSDFKTETAEKTRRHLNIPLEPTVMYDEYVDEVVLRLRIEQSSQGLVWEDNTLYL